MLQRVGWLASGSVRSGRGVCRVRRSFTAALLAKRGRFTELSGIPSRARPNGEFEATAEALFSKLNEASCANERFGAPMIAKPRRSALARKPLRGSVTPRRGLPPPSPPRRLFSDLDVSTPSPSSEVFPPHAPNAPAQTDARGGIV